VERFILTVHSQPFSIMTMRGVFYCLAFTALALGAAEKTMSGNEPAETVRKADLGLVIEFDDESYLLLQNETTPAVPVTEVRKYLRKNETDKGFRKAVALRQHITNSEADAASLAKDQLDRVRKEHPGSYVREIELKPESATVLFTLVKDAEVEFHLWQYRKTPTRLVSAQFMIRNKPPYDTQKKFVKEQTRNYKDWLEELTKLAAEAETYLTLTSGGKLAPTEMQTISR
jgi:hypothetical protein